jgi:hypothetical protein
MSLLMLTLRSNPSTDNPNVIFFYICPDGIKRHGAIFPPSGEAFIWFSRVARIARTTTGHNLFELLKNGLFRGFRTVEWQEA